MQITRLDKVVFKYRFAARTWGSILFIHAVETPRKVNVTFNDGILFNGNKISLLTGPNGSGKTDVLATIADVFHGALQYTADARVHWSSNGPVQVSENWNPSFGRQRIRVVAQTFSPFSRFPGIELRPPVNRAPLHARGHLEDEAYICIGFNQHSRVDLRTLALSILENGILRLSEQPKAARVVLDVLSELDFKDGIDLGYKSDSRLSSLLRVADEPQRIEKILKEVERSRNFIVEGQLISREKISSPLIEELRNRGIGEVAEFVRGSINIISSYIDDGGHGSIGNPEKFTFRAFRGRDAMSSDYPALQAFSLLRRLDLLTLERCTLYPYTSDPVDLTHTSSGQQQMLCSIFGLAAALEDDAVVLIDEPELSLHPRWQMSFIKHLTTALEAAVGCHVIIATHSPLIAQAGASIGAEIIPMGNDDVNNHHLPGVRGRDMSVEELLVNVFDTPVPSSLHITNKVFSLVTSAESGGKEDRYRSIEELKEYIGLYQREGHDGGGTVSLLKRAIKLISESTLSTG